MSVQINVAANQAALTASIQAGVQAYNQRFAQNNQLNLTINPRAFSQPLGRITGDVKDFEAALAASNARVIAFGASTAVLGGVIRSFKELANVTIEVEKNLADINRVFGLTTSQLQKFSTDLFNVTKQTASSFNDASQAALEFSRQGLKAEETLQRTKDALTLTRLAGVSTANAVDALTSTVNGFAATGVTTTQILNKLVAVEQDFAVGAGDLAEALSRTGQAAQEAGVSLDQLNALVTSAQQSTARGGAVIGNALKTIFTRLQRTDTLDQLEAFNISVRDVQGNILPAVTILQNFAGAYQNLADAQRAQLSEQVAGVYQVNILKAIVNDLNKSQGVYAGALQRGAMATNEAEVATAKLNQTLDALLKQTATSTQQLANNIGKVTFEPLARYGTEQLKSLVESMNEILEGEGIGSTFANGLLKGIRNILAGPGAIAAFFTLFKLIQNSFTYLTQALPQIAGITTETQNRKNIEQSILQIMAQQGPVAQALAGTMGNQAAQAQLLLQVARQQTAEYQTQTALARQLAAQLAGQGVRVRGSGGLQVTRAGGYIPASTKLAEVVGAQAGGYSPGRVVPSPVGGVMNTAEDVKYIPGFAQPFINPPARSKAGRAHRQNAINRTGVDPYMNNGFIPNFAVKQFINDKGEVITGKKPNKTRDSYTLRLANYNPKNLKADEDLDLKRNLVDSGYWNDSVRDPKTGKIIHYHGERNNIYDTLSGNLKVVKYLNKDEVDKATKIAWDGLISGNKAWISDPDITKLGMDQSSVEAAFDRTKAKLGLKLEDFQFKKQASEDSSKAASNEKYRSLKTKTVYKTSEEFEKSLKGDFSNFIGDFYEQLVLKNKNVSDDYQISAGNTDPADLVPKILGSTMYKGIEAKNTAARINDLIAKAIRINVPKMNQETWDKSNDVDFGTLPIYQTMGARATVSHNGFIPNFSPLIDDNARNKHDFPGGIPILPIPDKALQNIVDRQKKRQMTYLDFDRTLVRTMGDIAYSRVSPDQKKGVLQKMFLNKEARLNDIKNSKLTQFGELLRKKIQEGVINPSLLGLLTASDETPGMPEYISSIWGIPKRNQVYSAKPGTKEARLADLGVSASGFIPNFAPPTSAMRIPWFKKFSNASFDAIQPTLGISKASDTDTFRSSQFRSKAFDKAAIDGDPNLFAPLYEDFAFKAMQLISQSDIKDDLMRGYVLQPGTDQKQAALDAVYRKKGIGVEYKGYPKKNLTGTIGGELKRKYETLSKTNPEEAAKLQELIIAFNEVGHENQLPSDFGKNFSQLAGTSYSEMVKNSPDLVKGLSAETNMLLERYVKDPNFLRMNAAGGFIPNFAMGDKMRTRMMKDNLRVIVHDLKTGKEAYAQPGKKGKEYLYHKDAYNAELKTSGANVNDYDFAELHNLVRGFIYPNGKIVWDYSEKQQEALKDPNIKAKILAKLLAVETRIPKSIESSKPLTDFQRTRALLNNSYSGFIPNFNFIKGRNSFQKNWLIETAKKRNLNLNDPNTFTKLATEFAKTYPNDQGMFGLNKGFIPNFAYKQAVMGLEESMSGNKAVFDTKPFPHIRNSSQPTFSSAISDHGGLSNALSDSMRGQKAAGLMSNGFVPNFAPRPYRYSGRGSVVDPSSGISQYSAGLGFSLADQERRAKDEFNRIINALRTGAMNAQQATTAFATLNTQAGLSARAQTSLTRILNREVAAQNQQQNQQQNTPSLAQRFLGARGERADRFASSRLGGVAGVLGGSLIGGQIESFIQGGRERYQMSTGERFAASAGSGILTATTTGAEIGSFIPGLGTAAGAAIGAIIGLSKAAYDSGETLQDLVASAEQYKTQINTTVDLSKSYIDQLSQLNSISNPSLLNQASFKLTETFQQLSRSSPELGRKFVEAGGDIDKMNKAIEEFTANANLISNIKNLKASYKEAGDKLSALIPERSNQLKRKGYNIIQGSGEIKNTEASLETSFIQFQSFFDLLKQSGLTAENSEKFIAEFQKEMQAATDESTLKAIAKKYNISETIATEIAALSDNVIDEMGVEGDYFVENSGILIKRFFDTTDNKFKTATQQVEKQQINARPIIKRIEDSISIFVMNTASKIQTLEFEQNRLKMLQDASNFYLESLTSPIEKAAKEAKFKSKELETKTLQNRQKITSDILENFGKNAAQTLGGSNVDTISKIEGLIKNIEIASPIDQLSTIERLITQTTSTTTAADAGFKVTDPKTLESLNSSLINFRKNLVSLIQTEKENSALLNLEIDINKRRSESAQKLLILQNQLIESDLRRTISIADQRSQIDIQENRVQNIRRLPGFGFGVSESQIAATNIAQNRGFMQQRQQQTRLEVLGGIKTETQGAIKPLIINFENTRRSLLKEMYSAGDYRPEQARNAGLELNRLNTEQGPQKDLFAQFLKNLDNVKSLEEANTLITNFFNTLDKTSSIYTAVKSQVEKVSGALRDINKESQIFESNANADIKIADVNDKINNAYIFRLNTLLQIEKAQRKVLNTIEIQEQILDVERSRPANFFGLGVTGKAEKQIGYDEKNLALRQRRQNAQAVQNVQQQLNQFETFRNKIQAEGLGPQSFGFPASSDKIKKAREAIMSLDTSKITNIDQAKNFVSELSKVRTQYGLQGEAAKTLADTEKEINSVLNSNVDELDKMRSIQDILNGKVRQEAKDRQSIRMGFKEGFDQIQDDADTGLNRLAKETPILFRDGMVEAIKATVRESDNLGNALMGIAAKFLDTFSTQLMTTGVSKIISGSGLGNLFGMQTGGVIRAQNGMYISGSGSGDKYPALLENGEYVLNRQAVMAMGGPSALDTLNFSMAPRFASGGSFDKKFEDVASMESNMTQMGLENSPLYNELTDAAKQQAQEDRRKRLAAKQQRAAMIGSLVAAAATVAIGAGISNVAKNAQATKAQNLSAKLQTSQPLTQAESGSIRGLMDKGLLSPSGVYTGGVPQTGLRSLFSAPVQGSTWYQKFGNTVSKPFRRNQTGGLIGSRLSDTIPGYMEGGLYNAPLIKKYSAGLQSGGSSMMADGNNSSTVNNNTSATNSFNFNTTVQRDGTINMGSNSTSYEQQDVELSKNLNNKIYAAVGEVIRKEKQFGGSLAGMRNS